MRILHLSDIHLSKSNMKDYKYFSIEALLKDLELLHSKKPIDLVLITGDLIDQGGHSFKGIDIAFKEFEKIVIDAIADNLNICKSNFIFAPGNHDIDRDSDEIIEEYLKKNLTDTAKVNKFIDDEDEEKVKRILPFKIFEKKFHEKFSSEKLITNFQSAYKLNINGISIGINALNTAWRCYDSETDKNQILLGERQIFNGLEFIKDCDIKIAIMHHYVDWLAGFEQETIFKFIKLKYDMLFCGHVHHGSTFIHISNQENLFVSVASLNRSDNSRNTNIKYSNGYSIIDCIPNKVRVYNRKYVHDQIDYVADTEKAKNQGIEEFPFQTKKINNAKLNKLNEDIVESKETESYRNHNENIINLYSSNGNAFDENIVIRDKKNDTFIINCEKIFRVYIENISSRSNDFKNATKNLDELIIIIDKVFLIMKTRAIDLKAINLMRKMKSILENLSECRLDTEKQTYLNDIFIILECWIKTIYEVFNIYEFQEDLRLSNLIDTVLDNNKYTINKDDEFIKLWTSLKDTYKFLTSEDMDMYELNKISNSNLISQSIVGIALPVLMNYEIIRTKIRNINIGQIESTEIKDLIQTITSDYKYDDNEKFVGRELEIDRIYNSFIKNQYTIIRGEDGSGKTAIISRVISKLSKDYFKTDFSSSIILHSFKQSKSIHELVKSIIEQCNLKLLNKICTNYLDEVNEANDEVNNEENNYSNIYAIYKKYINEAISRLIQENNEIYIILDSLNLIGQHQDKIEKLFTNMPRGSHIILSSSFENECINFFCSNRQNDKEIIDIENFDRKDIPYITGIFENEQNKKAKEDNDKIYDKTKGNIRLINELISKIRHKDGISYDISKLNYLDKNKIDEYQLKASKWICSESLLLEDILLFLAVFHEVSAISLDKLQSFLKLKGYKHRLPRIRKELDAVSVQLSYLTYNKIMLIGKDYVNFVITDYFSKEDINLIINEIFAWLATDTKLENEFTINFLRYIKNSRLIQYNNFENDLINYIDTKAKHEQDCDLYEIGRHLYFDYKDMTAYAFKMLEKSVEMKNTNAMGFLGYCLLNDNNIEQDVLRGEKLLREAASSGNSKAMRILGEMLIEGDVIEKNECEGIKYIKEAMLKGNVSAKLSFANKLLIGRGVKRDPEKGKELLVELADKENVEALFLLGNRLIDGLGMVRNEEEGEKLLIKAIKLGCTKSKYVLAIRLLEGIGLTTDANRAMGLIYEAIEENNIDAKRTLGRLLINGKYIEKDVDKGIEIIEKLVDEDDNDSALLYAKLLINGRFIARDVQKAVKLLEKKVNDNNVDAMIFLANNIIDGKLTETNYTYENGMEFLESAVKKGNMDAYVDLALRLLEKDDEKENVKRGIALLEEAVSKDDRYAKVEYGIYLLEKGEDNEDKERAKDLLNNAIIEGSIKALSYLGNELIEGQVIPQDAVRGKAYLEEAINRGSIDALRILGHRLFFGRGLQKTTSVGENMLLKAIDKEDTLSKTILGHGIVIGYSTNFDITKGINFLNEAANEKENNACRILGEYLIEGKYINQDKKKGEKLLRFSAQDGNKEARRILATMLLDGKYLTQDINQGKEFLNQAIEDGDKVALNDLATRLLDGKGLELEKKRGEDIFVSLVEQKNTQAMVEYGNRLIDGKGVIRNPSKGEKLLREAMLLGDDIAKRSLGQNIIYESIEASNKEEGIELLEECIKNEDQFAMYFLGRILIDGKYIDKNIDRGIKLIERAIDSKNIQAKLYLADLLIGGVIINQDIDRGINLLLDAIKEGSIEAKIYYAECLLEGEIISKDEKKGIEILNNLIMDGSKNAQRVLAKMLIKGDRVKQDVIRGVELYKDAIAKDDAEAMIEYGKLLMDGRYLERNGLEGKQLLEQAIRKASIDVNYIMAKEYITGRCLKKNKSKASKKFQKAVNEGNIYARFEYGLRLQFGNGFKKNEDKGKMHVQHACKNLDSETKLAFGIIAYKLRQFELATTLIYEAFNEGLLNAGVSLAYLVRRNEIKGEQKIPKMRELLERALNNNDSQAKINYALNLAKLENDWESADAIFRDLDLCMKSLEWWFDISKEGDAEGNLVLGWIGKYKQLTFYDKTPFTERLKVAYNKGWGIPNWIYSNPEYINEVAVTTELIEQSVHDIC